jgi:pilus assembly protein CpaD
MTTNLFDSIGSRPGRLLLAMCSVLLLAGCQIDGADLEDNYNASSHEERYPIRVAEAPVKMNLSAKAGTLRPEQVNSVIGFAQDARNNAVSRISVRWSSGSSNARMAAHEAINVMIEQGVPQSMIATGSYRGNGSVVSMAFMRKVAVTKECGDWSDDLAGDQSNKSYRNHGCATQQNIAAMVANPEDFERPRAMSPAPAASRTLPVTKYYAGQ